MWVCVDFLICYPSGKPEVLTPPSFCWFWPLDCYSSPSLHPATSALFRPSCSTWTIAAKHLTTSGLPVSRLSLCCYPVFSTYDHATSCLKPLVPQCLWFQAELWFKSHFDREGEVPSFWAVVLHPHLQYTAFPSTSGLRTSFILQYLLQLCIYLKAFFVPLSTSLHLP